MSEDMFTTNLQELWFEYYFSTEAWLNATKAAELAGYKWPNISGPRNLKKFPEIIKERLKTEVMSQDEALARVSRIARAPFGECMTSAGLDMSKVVELGLGDLIKKHKKSQNGVTVEFYSADDALKTILRTHDMLNDHITVDVNIGFKDILDEVYGDEENDDG